MNPSMKSDANSKAATVEPATFESKLKADAQRSNDTALEHTSEWRESERPKAARPLSYINIMLAYEYVPENAWAEHSNTDDRRRSEERGKGVAGRWEQAISGSYDQPTNPPTATTTTHNTYNPSVQIPRIHTFAAAHSRTPGISGGHNTTLRHKR
jgi:hypothetical protein